MKNVKISSPCLGIEPTTSRVYSHTLLAMRDDLSLYSLSIFFTQIKKKTKLHSQKKTTKNPTKTERNPYKIRNQLTIELSMATLFKISPQKRQYEKCVMPSRHMPHSLKTDIDRNIDFGHFNLNPKIPLILCYVKILNNLSNCIVM